MNFVFKRRSVGTSLVVKNLHSKEGNSGLFSGWGTKIPHSPWQLSPSATSGEGYTLQLEKTACCGGEPTSCSERPAQPKKSIRIKTKEEKYSFNDSYELPSAGKYLCLIQGENKELGSNTLPSGAFQKHVRQPSKAE